MDETEIPLEALPDVVLGRDRRYPRAEAMARLAASSHPERESLLGRVLERPDDERRYRVVAAITLGRIDTPAAQQRLLGNLRDEQPALNEVLRSLGRIGDREALAAIESLKLPGDHPARGTAAWAASLISYRLGLSGHQLRMPTEAELLHRPADTVALRIDVRKLEPEAATVVVEALRRYPYGGVALDPASVTRLTCAGEVNIICMNRQFSGPGGLEKALERKAFVAVGALQSPETGDYSPSYLVMTHPTGAPGAVELIAPRCSGTFALAGTGRIAGDRAEFELRSVRRPGARSIFVRGAVVNGVIEAAEAVSSRTKEPARIVQRVVVERV
jgi:hypothetical protein